MIRVAINGFGRIGRLAFREIITGVDFDIVAINDLSPAEDLAYLLKYDTNHRSFHEDLISFENDSLVINQQKKIKVYKESDPENLPWENLEIDLPSLKQQQKIVNILGKIDDKIELNNKMNNNFSEIVLTLFNEFLNNYKERTELVELKDCVEKIGTGADAIQRAPIVNYDTGIRCIRVGDMTNNRKYHEWGFTKMTEKDFNNYKLDIGDIVITRTAVNGITKIIDDKGKIVCNNGLIRLKINNKYNKIFIYLCTKTKEFNDYIRRIDSETSVRPNMKVNYLTSYHIKKIPLEKQNEFCNKIAPILSQKKVLEQEIYILKQLRDTLLPKLINGEISLERIDI